MISTSSEQSFTMPILGTKYRVTWTPTPGDMAQAETNHGGQTLKGLASRGGLSWCELAAVVANERYKKRDEGAARALVHHILRLRTAETPKPMSPGKATT